MEFDLCDIFMNGCGVAARVENVPLLRFARVIMVDHRGYLFSYGLYKYCLRLVLWWVRCNQLLWLSILSNDF